MIAAAALRLAAFPHVTTAVADVHALPFADAAFDAVLLLHTLTYAEAPPVALREAARVLRPGGRVVVLSLAAHAHHELTAPYGERHPGFAPEALRSLFRDAGLGVRFCDVACREPKKPHFEVVLGVANK
jgi:ArsR family transcriptional regulator